MKKSAIHKETRLKAALFSIAFSWQLNHGSIFLKTKTNSKHYTKFFHFVLEKLKVIPSAEKVIVDIFRDFEGSCSDFRCHFRKQWKHNILSILCANAVEALCTVALRLKIFGQFSSEAWHVCLYRNYKKEIG